jgi:hypothetical protein
MEVLCRRREKYGAFQRLGKGKWQLMQPARRPVIANPQGEAIQCTRMDCFTLRVRNDVRDNLNCPSSFRTEGIYQIESLSLPRKLKINNMGIVKSILFIVLISAVSAPCFGNSVVIKRKKNKWLLSEELIRTGSVDGNHQAAAGNTFGY